MKINEVEQTIGIAKKNIRFYEQEGLINPARGANGYRDYTQADIDILLQIKLLRKLDIPLAEIKRIQSGSLTLEDCLRRHLIVLERRSKTLEAMESFCGRILSETAESETLPVEQLLSEMEKMEKGGMKFLGNQKGDKKKRKKDSIIAAVIAISLMVMILTIMLLSIFFAESGTLIMVAILVASFPTVAIIGTLLALKERLREIEGGELYEASKY